MIVDDEYVTPAISKKALKMLGSERIAKTPAEVFLVRGDTDSYRVIYVPGSSESEPQVDCNCQRGSFGQVCSHAVAVLWMKQQAPTKANLAKTKAKTRAKKGKRRNR